MKKLNIILMMLLLCSFVAAREVPTIDVKDNLGKITATDKEITIDRVYANSGETVVLDIVSLSAVKKVCFEFDKDTSLIEINDIKKKIPFWIDTDYTSKAKKTKNSICYDVDLDNANLYFTPVYKGRDTIKYNITFDDVVLDPYLIGTLANDTLLTFRLPFDLSSEAAYASVPLSLTSSNTRTLVDISNYSVSVISGTFTNPQYAFDSSTTTYAYQSVADARSSEYWFFPNKTTADTGANIYINYVIYKSDLSYVTELTGNYTIPDACFTYDSSMLRFRLYTGSGTSPTTYLQCYSGSWNTLASKHWEVSGDYGSHGYWYDTKVYITNQTGFSAYNNTLPPIEYLNLNGLIYGNLFKFYGGYKADALRNIMAQAATAYTCLNNVTFNTSGANFDGIDDYINTTLNLTGLVNVTMSIEFTPKLNSQNAAMAKQAQQFGIFLLNGNISIYDWNITTFKNITVNTTANTKYVVTAAYNSTNVTVFVNGVEKETYPYNKYAVPTVNVNLSIGANAAGTPDSVFNGSIHNFLFWNRTLTNAEILTFYNKGNFTDNKIGEPNSSIKLTGNETILVSNISGSASANSSYTISYWINITNGSTIMGTYKAGLYLGVYSLDKTGDNTTTFSRSVTAETVTCTLTQNEWTHLVKRYDAATNNMSLYKNGAYCGSNLSYYATSFANQFAINSYNNYSNFHSITTTTELDELMFFSYALDETQIRVLYSGYNYTSLDDCTAFNNTLLDMTIFNEDDINEEVNATLELYIKYGTNGTNYTSEWSNIYTGASNYRICLSNLNATVTYELYAAYTSAYTHRYYLFNTTYTGTPQTLLLGNYKNTTGKSKLQITIRDIYNYSTLPDIVGTLQRFYVSDGAWRTVQMDKSGDYGTVNYDIRESDTDYRIIFSNTDNEILKTTGTIKFICTQSINGLNLCDLTYVLDPNPSTTGTAALVYNVTFYNNTGIFNLSFNDTTGLTNSMRFYITTQENGRNIVACNKSITAAAGNITCNVSIYNGSFHAYVFTTASPERAIFSQWYEYIKDLNLRLLGTIGDREATFWAFGIVLLVTAGSLFSPVAAMIMTIFGLIVVNLLGLATFTTTFFITLAAIVAITISIKVKV